MINVDIDLENRTVFFHPNTPLCDVINFQEELDLENDWKFMVKDEDDDEGYVYTFKPSA